MNLTQRKLNWIVKEKGSLGGVHTKPCSSCINQNSKTQFLLYNVGSIKRGCDEQYKINICFHHTY